MIDWLQMSMKSANPGLAAPINPLHVNVRQITAFFRHQSDVVGNILQHFHFSKVTECADSISEVEKIKKQNTCKITS